MAYDANAVAKLGHLASFASKVKSELTALDEKYAGSFRSLSVSGNTVSFFTTTDASGTAVASFDFPEELYLQQTGTEIVADFAWSAATYPGSTNPNLDGKTVLILAVKGNKSTNATVKYSFVDMANVIKAISAGDASITINGYAVSVRLSEVTGNLLELKSDGLFVGSDDTKVDKVTNATSGNFVLFGANGAIADSGFKIASDADVNEMLETYFPSGE